MKLTPVRFRSAALELLAAYRLGWWKGASSGVCPTSEKAVLEAELKRGYEDGAHARQQAEAQAVERLGISPDELMKGILR